MGKLQVVVGGQFGSEAKGSVCAHLLRENRRELQRSADRPRAPIFEHGHERVLGMRVGGPNAGHTVYSDDGIEFKFRHVPVAAIADPEAELALAAGSEVNRGVLLEEIQLVNRWREDHGFSSILPRVDRQATLIEQHHIDQEYSLTSRVGSTAKGIGAARADRIWRSAQLWDGHAGAVDTTKLAYEVLADGGLVQIEGIQGYGLGLHAGYYPYCTSSDCRAVDFMSMTGLSPWDPRITNDIGDSPEVWVVLRTRPIRVAGNSGPLQGETSWDEIGLPEERTTVTNRVRRVGEWDPELAAAAIEANGGTNCKVAVTMLDQLFPQDRGSHGELGLSDEALDWIEAQEKELGISISMVTTSPTTYIQR